MNNTIKTFAIKGMLDEDKSKFIARLSLLLDDNKLESLVNGVIHHCYLKKDKLKDFIAYRNYYSDSQEFGYVPTINIKDIYPIPSERKVEFIRVYGIKRYYKTTQDAEKFRHNRYSNAEYSNTKTDEYQFEGIYIVEEYDSIAMDDSNFTKFFDCELL